MKIPKIAIAGGLTKDFRVEFAGDYYTKVNNNYPNAIFNAGGIPIILPLINDINIIQEQLSCCDGLLLPGGIDVNPLSYEELPKPLLGNTNSLVDWYHISLVKKAFEMDIPILGICRGCQVINVAFGGTLYQDISYATETQILHKQDSHLSERCHPIFIEKNSFIYDIFGSNYLVNSAHHQAVKNLGNNFIISSISPDGIIESIEMQNKNFVVGVQWHPEMLALKDDTMLNLFIKFINSCNTK